MSLVQQFDDWIRGGFAAMNTELEELYFAQPDRSIVEGVGEDIKARLMDEGDVFIKALLAEGNTDEGFDQAFALLGNVGMYMAAARRHEITEPSRERTSPLVAASSLAMHLGASLGVTPRFATSHLATHNMAVDGRYKTFTDLADERLFLEFNTRGVFAYKRAADALVRTLPLGVSHPLTHELLGDAKNALIDVAKWNDVLFSDLDADRFFYCVRPYYKPHRVGSKEYRGANAGDFAGINEIDLLLGLCSADNLAYSQLLVDKFLYMMPEDQNRLRDVMRRQSLLDGFLGQLQHRHSPWFKKNVGVFLEVCEAHGYTARQHHDQLVDRFIDRPSHELPEDRLKNITASGPPLNVLLRSLADLRDLRLAAPRDDIPSRHADIRTLRNAVDH